jgi:hypothetical protein
LPRFGDDDLIDFMRSEAIEDFEALGLEFGCVEGLDSGHGLAIPAVLYADQSYEMTTRCRQGAKAMPDVLAQ